MKLSLSWIFEHISGSWKNLDIPDLINKFNTTTAEIEQEKLVELDLSHFYIVRLIEIKKESIVGFCPELNKEFKLPHRPEVYKDDLLLIKTYKNDIQWATLIDLWSEKEGLVPVLRSQPKLLTAKWKDDFRTEDYIIQLENKSLTHRPDLWSHRGIAREIAAIIGVPLKDENQFLEKHTLSAHEQFASATAQTPFATEIADTTACKRLATLYCKQFDYQASDLTIAHRLASIDARPLNLIVDLTNYVMFDIGQPMHAFDAQKIKSKKVIAKRARANQKISLLDGQMVELSDEDLIISDGEHPLALAGIMGGAESAITTQTKTVLLEAACFDATTIRRTALRLKKRTEASTRFEKSLDPNLNVVGMQRFLKLCNEYAAHYKVDAPIVSLGKEAKPLVLTVEHAFIEQKLGTAIPQKQVVKILQSIGMQVTTDNARYQITVPTFRCTKDITGKEDIVEEVGRFFGYNAIPLQLPQKNIEPHNEQWMDTLRTAKNTLATSLRAHEVYNYSLYDEQFLSKLQWQPTDAVAVQNPVSQNWQQLVTSLVPHLIKNIVQNAERRQAMRFFELNHVWNLTSKNRIQERTMLAGIAYHPKESVDFYQIKDQLSQLFCAIHLDVTWKKAEYIPFVWMHPYQTAFIMHQDVLIGYAGKSDPAFTNNIIEGDAFIFEFDADVLLAYANQEKKFKPLAKYPMVWQDVSMFVPLTVTVADIVTTVQKIDKRIFDVSLVDFFEKAEWGDKKSVTIRWSARDPEKTLNKDDIDDIQRHVVIALQSSLHATIR